MKAPAIDQLVYNAMFPKPKSTDPQNFHSVLTRYLIFEVRQEVHAFYGHLDTQEAKYPGLDYTHPTHRVRLSRWQWHRRLFRAMDALRLTPGEVANLTRWEGTKWAKERFEKEQGVLIRDTATDGIPRWVEPERRMWTRSIPVETEIMGRRMVTLPRPDFTFQNAVSAARAHTSEERNAHINEDTMSYSGNLDFANPLTSDNVLTDFDFDSFLNDGDDDMAGRFDFGQGELEQEEEELSPEALAQRAAERGETQAVLEETPTNPNTPSEEDEEDDDEEDDDGELRSIGVSLNARLRERVAAHNAGDTSLPIDEAWEQWLKNALETGELEHIATLVEASGVSSPTPRASAAGSSSRSGAPSQGGQSRRAMSSEMSRALSYQPYLFTATMFETARAGNWADVPEFLHDMFRRRLSGQEGGSQAPQPPRRQYSDLRLPVAPTGPPEMRVQRRARGQA